MGETQLERMQFRIMQVLWDRGRADAREITEALNETEQVAHSTVQTLLRQLEAKGAVGHEAEDRTFVFFPRVIATLLDRRAIAPSAVEPPRVQPLPKCRQLPTP